MKSSKVIMKYFGERRKKNEKLLTDIKDDSEENNDRQNIKIGIDGTFWKKSKQVPFLGEHSIFKDITLYKSN